ncbi:MAG: hypothetical protein IJ567_01545 [Lachnospiraceae bacterium]|nr:hypothetical protein [Lachnospiraceae bacterium]
MPTNEKEYNGNLLDQKHILKRIKKTALETNDVEKIIAAIDYELADIDEKLYQQPPMTYNN